VIQQRSTVVLLHENPLFYARLPTQPLTETPRQRVGLRTCQVRTSML